MKWFRADTGRYIAIEGHRAYAIWKTRRTWRAETWLIATPEDAETIVRDEKTLTETKRKVAAHAAAVTS